MFGINKFTIAAAAAFAGTIAAASANDDGKDLAAKICNAATSVTSFQATMSGLLGMNAQVTVVRPDRVKYVGSFGPVTSEVVVVGATTYLRMNGGAWTTSTSNGAAAAAKQLAETFTSGATYAPLPDRRENGTTVGAFTATIFSGAAGAASAPNATKATAQRMPPLTETCTYDKTSFLVRACSMHLPNLPAPITMTYSKWNDPGNAVAAPADAPAAPVVPSPDAGGASSTTPAPASATASPTESIAT